MSKSQIERVRRLCLSLPDTSEKLSHGEPTFFVRKKVFCMFANNHHDDGHIAVWLPVPSGTQSVLIESAPAIYFNPPYVGVRGWVGIELGKVKDAELKFHIETAWQLVAPKRLLSAQPKEKMAQNQSLQDALKSSKDHPIHIIGKFIENHIHGNWKAVVETRRDRLLDAYNRAGDMAYGTYGEYLFRPVHKALKEAGLHPVPNLPGKFDISREWGNDAQTHQQRWMWSTIRTLQGEALGTIVIVFYHDHTQFRISRKPKVLALTETGKEDVIQELSRRSRDFKKAREASVEIAEYLANLDQQRAASAYKSSPTT